MLMVPTILIVDDEGDFIELVKFRLSALGCEFLVANDGLHALSQAREFKPDLILLDILLPDLDGLSVCEILKRQPATKKIPIIFMSALSAGVTKRTVAIQAEDFFTKPLDLPRLERRVVAQHVVHVRQAVVLVARLQPHERDVPELHTVSAPLPKLLAAFSRCSAQAR